MRKALSVAILLLPLVGCMQMPWPTLSTQLGEMKGKPVKTVFDRIGYPNSQGEIAGEKFYSWSNASSLWVPSSTTTTGVGTVGATPFNYSQTSIGGGETANWQCSIRVFYNKDEIVTHSDFSGQAGACAKYAARLDPSYNDVWR